MEQKEFKINGATILVLQVDGRVYFFMQIKSHRLFHCTSCEGKVEDVTEEDAIDIWNRYHEKVGKLDDAWIAELEKNSKRRKPWKRRKKSSSDSSEPLIREIRP